MNVLYIDNYEYRNYSLIKGQSAQSQSVERNGKTYVYKGPCRHSAWDQPGIWNTIRGIWNFILCCGFSVVDNVYVTSHVPLPNNIKSVNFYFSFCDQEVCCKEKKNDVQKHHITILFLDNNPTEKIVNKACDTIRSCISELPLKKLTWSINKKYPRKLSDRSVPLMGDVDQFVRKVREEVLKDPQFKSHYLSRAFQEDNFGRILGTHFAHLDIENYDTILKTVSIKEIKICVYTHNKMGLLFSINL